MTSGQVADVSHLAVSVIIPHFNAPEHLALAIESVQAAAGIQPHVIVVDNSTDDAMRRSAQEIASDHSATWLGMTGNVGFAAACNAGAANATSDLLLFFNQDAQLSSGSLLLLLEHIAGSPTCGAVAPAIVTPQGKIWFNGGRYRERSGRIFLRDFGKPHSGGEPTSSLFLSGCAFLTRRDLFEELGAFDERFFLYYEDVELSERIRQAGWTLHVVPDAVVVHDRGQIGDPMRNLSSTMLTNSIRSRRIFGKTRQGSARWVARATLPLEVARLSFHALRANPRRAYSTAKAILKGLAT
jgi:GT2 family glycosyltransferase